RPVPDAGDHAGRVGRVQSVAGADEPRHRDGAGGGGGGGAARRPAGGCGRGGGCRRGAGLWRRPGGGGAVLAAPDRAEGVEVSAMLERRAAVRRLLAQRPEKLLVVAGLGTPAYDLYAAGDHDANFYLWGAMGGAAMIGL